VFLKQGHRAADPVLLMADDGIVGMDMRPGAQNKGGVTADGKPLVHTLPTGDIQISDRDDAARSAASSTTCSSCRCSRCCPSIRT
jgi:hypothetical protein